MADHDIDHGFTVNFSANSRQFVFSIYSSNRRCEIANGPSPFIRAQLFKQCVYLQLIDTTKCEQTRTFASIPTSFTCHCENAQIAFR